MALYFYSYVFIIYSVLGWCAEVGFAAATTGKFVNRGFLNGPYCPIYGTGVAIVLLLLTPLQGSLPALFAGAVLLTSALEFLTGFVLEKLFHQRWWDYSGKPLNICGYVCVTFSLVWGLACVVVVKLVQPLIAAGIHALPFRFGAALAVMILALMLSDAVVSVRGAIMFNRYLKSLDDVAKGLKKLSNTMGRGICAEVINACETAEKARAAIDDGADMLQDRIEELQDRAEEFQDKAEELQAKARAELIERRNAIVSGMTRSTGRIIKAFPTLKSVNYSDAYDLLRADLDYLISVRKK